MITAYHRNDDGILGRITLLLGPEGELQDPSGYPLTPVRDQDAGDLVELSETGMALCEVHGLNVDVDAYGCAYCTEHTISNSTYAVH
jgi:hypothetical protein